MPRGARVRRAAELPLRIHYTDQWGDLLAGSRAGMDGLAHAALLAAASFANPRRACGILAATVQQQLLRHADLVAALTAPDGCAITTICSRQHTTSGRAHRR